MPRVTLPSIRDPPQAPIVPLDVSTLQSRPLSPVAADPSHAGDCKSDDARESPREPGQTQSSDSRRLESTRLARRAHPLGDGDLHLSQARSVAWSHNDRFIATLALGGTLKLWDMHLAECSEPVQSFPHALHEVQPKGTVDAVCAAWSPGDRWLAMCGYGGRVVLRQANAPVIGAQVRERARLREAAPHERRHASPSSCRRQRARERSAFTCTI